MYASTLDSHTFTSLEDITTWVADGIRAGIAENAQVSCDGQPVALIFRHSDGRVVIAKVTMGAVA